ncbi:Serine/threonine protein kinase [Formivibrio citricus]|uniref:non-specific serine/threonine protein kinase n=1 Tax=Formivibrio citricus TaxID=83765 RepID=A0A1I4YIN7_9NEIS|nr:serine/threonine-protein kinase [Formivibrio citricus]SFN37882.1 Serine/threonine protein kinase [Formivibrio citricus]
MKKLGKYQLLNLLGGGATADVYLAQDTFLQQRVALKIFKHESLRDPAYAGKIQRMFQNEARLVRSLRHPGIVEILDAVQDESHAYIVMEYVEGRPLSTHARADNLLPVPQILQIAFKCCTAMQYAASRGLIHRDLKPDNLLLTPRGDVKISDFGTARQYDQAMTMLSSMMGTPAYMSPEQICEQPLDARSDIFALGIVLYELLTGTRPFQADTMMALLYRIQNETHPPLRAYRQDLPSALESLIDIALQKNPEARFSSWQAFADHLSAIDHTLYPPSNTLSDREKFLALRHNPFFAQFEEPEIWQALHMARWHRLKAGTVLMHENSPGNSFSILLDGEVEVRKQGKLLFILQPGACLGEMAFLMPDQPLRSATIKATNKVTVVKFSRESIENAGLDLRARFERRFLHIMVERLMDTTGQLASSAVF